MAWRSGGNERKMALHRNSIAIVLAALATVFFASDGAGQTEVPLLQMEAKIPPADVQGRIDHMAVDLARHRLFVADWAMTAWPSLISHPNGSIVLSAIFRSRRAWASIR
jgi:hypothetical protein